MKKYIILFLLVWQFSQTWGQWMSNGTTIYPNDENKTKNVGIGVSTATSRLHTLGTVRLQGLSYGNAATTTQSMATDANGNVYYHRNLRKSEVSLNNAPNYFIAENFGVGHNTGNNSLNFGSWGLLFNAYQDNTNNSNLIRYRYSNNQPFMILGRGWTKDLVFCASSCSYNENTNSLPVGNEVTDWVQAITITQCNGYVGILNSSPQYPLHVNGTTASGAYITFSDLRYKKNIQPIATPLALLGKMQGVSYDFRQDEFPEKNFDKSSAGFIAQDLEKIYPVAVSKDEKGFYAVNYDAVIPLLVEGIKEQQKMIESLQKELELLKSQK